MEQNTTATSQPVVQPKEDKKATLKALCLFFAIIALGAGGYILYDKIIAKSDKLQCEEAIEKDTKKEETTGGTTKKTDDDEKKEKSSNEKIGYVTSHDWFGNIYLTKSGDVYFMPNAYKNGRQVNTVIKNDSVLGKYGSYTITEDDVYFALMGESSAMHKQGYKLNYSNIRYATIIWFGNGSPSGRIVLIDNSGKMNVIGLDALNESSDGTNNYEAKLIGEIKEYEGAISIVEINEGDGIGNVVYYGDGSYELLDYEKFN